MPHQSFQTPRARRLLLTLGLLAWAVLLVAGFGRLWGYSGTPGVAHAAPATNAVRSDGRFDLLLFLHPECPCSRATLAELDRLLPAAGGRAAVHIYVVLPPGADDRWKQAPIVAWARRVSEAVVEFDPAGRAARQYGAATSGQVLLYAPDGRLAFSGGITASRGHEGDNAGSDAVASIVAGREPATRHTHVFGCALFDETDTDLTASPAKDRP